MMIDSKTYNCCIKNDKSSDEITVKTKLLENVPVRNRNALENHIRTIEDSKDWEKQWQQKIYFMNGVIQPTNIA